MITVFVYLSVFELAEPNNESPLNVEAAQLWDNKTGLQLTINTTLGEYRNFLLRYRAEFPIEFPLVSGNSIGNSALYCTCTVAGNSYIVPVLVVSALREI